MRIIQKVTHGFIMTIFAGTGPDPTNVRLLFETAPNQDASPGLFRKDFFSPALTQISVLL